jgi:hypothetical protein
MNPGTMVQNGTDFACTVNVKNTSQKSSTLSITTIVTTMEYTGKMKALVKREKLENITVDAGKGNYFKLLQYLRFYSD